MSQNEDFILCPVCGSENDALNKTCLACGQSLIQVCPRCNTVNAIAAGQCFACGQHFDTLGQIMARHEIRTSDRFTRQAATALEAKQTALEQDKVRHQQLWEQEQQREAYLLAQQQRQKQQEHIMLIATIITAIVAVTLTILYMALRQ